jgi:hypothetical protein
MEDTLSIVLESIEISSSGGTSLFTKCSFPALLYRFFVYVCMFSGCCQNRIQEATIDDDSIGFNRRLSESKRRALLVL